MRQEKTWWLLGLLPKLCENRINKYAEDWTGLVLRKVNYLGKEVVWDLLF